MHFDLPIEHYALEPHLLLDGKVSILQHLRKQEDSPRTLLRDESDLMNHLFYPEPQKIDEMLVNCFKVASVGQTLKKLMERCFCRGHIETLQLVCFCAFSV